MVFRGVPTTFSSRAPPTLPPILGRWPRLDPPRPLVSSPDHWLWLRCSQGELRAAQRPPPSCPASKPPGLCFRPSTSRDSARSPDSAPTTGIHGHLSQARPRPLVLWEEEWLARQHPSLASEWPCDAGSVSCALWASVSPFVRTEGEVTDSRDGRFALSGRRGAWAQVGQRLCPGCRLALPSPWGPVGGSLSP